MKTRQELLLDFMLALASSPAMVREGRSDSQIARDTFLLAAELVDKCYEVIAS